MIVSLTVFRVLPFNLAVSPYSLRWSSVTGSISASVAAFRLSLLRHGAVGLRPAGEEIAVLADEYGDQTVGAWTAALIDPSGWRNDADEHLRQCVVFLRCVWRRRPHLLPDWAARVLDCASQALPQDPEILRASRTRVPVVHH